MTTSQKSTSSPHFNQESPQGVIVCVSCSQPLWRMKVRTVQGKIVSTSTECVGKNTHKISGDTCPLCKKEFMKTQGKEKKVLIRSDVTGEFFTI